MITDLDKNKSGNIDFEEFLDMMTARMSDKDTREDISKVFRLFDDDCTGTITLRNLRRVARELGETMTDEELQEMIDRADSNGDAAVTMVSTLLTCCPPAPPLRAVRNSSSWLILTCIDPYFYKRNIKFTINSSISCGLSCNVY